MRIEHLEGGWVKASAPGIFTQYGRSTMEALNKLLDLIYQ